MIKRNAAKCLECGVVVESKHRHDFRSCRCGAIFVDGGHDYLRFGFTPGKGYELLNESEEEEGSE